MAHVHLGRLLSVQKDGEAAAVKGNIQCPVQPCMEAFHRFIGLSPFFNGFRRFLPYPGQTAHVFIGHGGGIGIAGQRFQLVHPYVMLVFFHRYGRMAVKGGEFFGKQLLRAAAIYFLHFQLPLGYTYRNAAGEVLIAPEEHLLVAEGIPLQPYMDVHIGPSRISFELYQPLPFG